MIWVVAYDIADDLVRSRVARVLEGFGVRVQESVFECRLGDAAFSELQQALAQAFPVPRQGSIRFYRLCADCWRASLGLGRSRGSDLDGPCIVV